MGTFAAYSFTSGIYLLAAYLVYKWLLSGENQPAFNRAVLLSLYALAFILPLSPRFSLVSGQATQVAISTEGGIQATAATTDLSLGLYEIVLYIYLSGMVVTALASIMAIIRLLSIIRNGRKITAGHYTLVILPQTRLSPFSWMRYIVMSDDDYKSAGEMITCHESAHLRLHHWIDLLLAQLTIIVLWYNPASWLMRTELRNIHEYQADSAVLRSGTDARQYQLLLIKKAVGRRFPSLANSLNHSKLKNRITMMCNQTSSPARRLRALAFAPALLLAAIAVNIPAVTSALNATSAVSLTADKGNEKIADRQNGNDVVSGIPEVLPQYPGGDGEMIKFMVNNIKYPKEAAEAGVQGRVVVEFVVDKNGRPTDITVKKSVSPELDAEALRIISIMPDWTPARDKGKTVGCKVTLPVSFKLQADDKTTK